MPEVLKRKRIFFSQCTSWGGRSYVVEFSSGNIRKHICSSDCSWDFSWEHRGATCEQGKGRQGPRAGRGCLWSSRSQRQPPGRAAVAPGVKYVTAAWSIDHCYRGLWPKWKFMKNWWSPQIIFFPFPFAVLCQCSEERLNEVLNALVARRLWFRGRGGGEIRPIFYLTFL